MNQFYKGRTNNHLTWVMVDATDFATPESALSAATKIKIYGKVRGATGVNFVSSGTGSLTNDIQHVGASALGIYTIALAKADLSDASAAWYDQYIINLSATGAAYQTLVVDGGIDASTILAFSDAISNAYSAAGQANSRVLLVQSALSDLDSRLVSDISDIRSMLTANSDILSNAYSAAVVGASRVLLVQSRLSDLDSRLASEFSDVYSRLSDMHSDINSKIGAITATVSASDISDIASAVWANTIGARVDSRILVAQSYLSDIRSNVSDLQSDFQSRVPKLVATNSQLSDLHSDLRSQIGAAGPTVSDIASAVWAENIALLLTSRVSDLQSKLSDVESNMLSVLTTTGVQLNASSLSDLRSAITAGATGLDASALSDIASAVVAAIGAAGVDMSASSLSDIRSMFAVTNSLASDAHSAAAQANSRALALVSTTSDIYSLLSDVHSDLGVLSGVVSDTYSAVIAPGASALSDIASAVWARAGADPTTVPAVTASMGAKLDWMTAVSRNKITQTATVQSLRNDNDSADIASAAVSDDGTTFTRGEFA